jgi:tetratricopeptide (TPR) repeat protein
LLISASCAAVLCGCDAVNARLRAKEGVAAYHGGDLPAAIAKLSEAAELAPNNPTLQIDLGFANLAQFQAQPASTEGAAAANQAIAAFERYLQLRPGEERARTYLVQTFVDSGQYDAAVAYFTPAVERTPPDGQALATLGNIASKNGKFAEARAWYEKRVAAEPANAEARLALGVLIWDHLHTHAQVTGSERTQLADSGIATLKEAMRLAPNSPNAYSYTTMLYSERALAAASDEQKQKDLQQARSFFSQANTRAGKSAPKLAQFKARKK